MFIWRCIYARLCVPFPNYKKVTGLDLIRIQGGCIYGCDNELLTVSYSYRVFNNLKYSDFSFSEIVWQEFELTKTYFSDWNNPYFEISSVLFNDFKKITYWKVELTVFTMIQTDTLLHMNFVVIYYFYSGKRLHHKGKTA